MTSRNGETSIHKIALESQDKEPEGNLDPGAFWSQEDRTRYHVPATDVRVSTPHRMDDFQYSDSSDPSEQSFEENSGDDYDNE